MDALDFLGAVTAASRAATPVPRGNRIATIDPAYVAGSFPGTLPRVTFDGETTLTTKRYAALSPYAPQPGHRVLMLPAGSTYIIAGRIVAA